MSKYTTEVRFICEHYSGLDESKGYDNVEEIIESAREKVFDFDYPIFDKEYKPTLEKKILRRYYTREIGLETVGLWKHFLCTRLNEIMPYYNKLYESELLKFNPFDDVDYTREGEKSNVQDREDQSNGNNKMTGTVRDDGSSTSTDGGSDSSKGSNEPKRDTWTLYSDTPQGGVAGINAAEASVGSNAYLTNATHVIESGKGSVENRTTNYGRTNESESDNTRTYNTDNKLNSSSTGQTRDNGDYFERVKGKMNSRSYASLLMELRESFLNIDLRIVNELGDLFMNIY